LQPEEQKRFDGHRAGFDGQSGAKRGDARDVHTLFAFGHRAAENHVVNFLGVQAGDARERFLDSERGKIIGACGAERAFVGTADGGADGGDDDGFLAWRDLAGRDSEFIVGREWEKATPGDSPVRRWSSVVS